MIALKVIYKCVQCTNYLNEFQPKYIPYWWLTVLFPFYYRCQDQFLKDIDLGPNIAANAALKENVFMMVICIELRIPLFLIGKPGSSKSLAKAIVARAMKGDHSKSPLYKSLKQVSWN